MERKLGFIFDHNKCILCNACVNACNKAYGNLNWRTLVVFPMEDAKTALSISCNHCDSPKCMEVCPANAIEMEEMGVVRIRQEACIGCGFCTWACPYEALKLNDKGVMTKCHFCYDVLIGGKGIPYCVDACPTGALAFGWVEKGETDVDYLPPYEITRPRIVVKPPEKGKVKAKILHQKKEENYLGLLAFTLGSEFALGYTLLRLPYWALVGFLLPLLTLLISVGHAKRANKFYRVVLNLRTSWLSREVLFSSLSLPFFLLSLLYPVLYYPAVAFLALGVASSVMIYMLKSRPSWYNVDTPVSFIGTAFSTTLPIAYLLGRDHLLLPVLSLVLAVEVLSSYLAKKPFKARLSLNVASIILSFISLILPELIITVEILNIVSEFSNRVGFYNKVLYYGLPKV